MPYSPNLKLELIDTGAQSGVWGNTTNNNLGTLLEQAIAGVQTITLTTVNKVLTNLNGLPSEARNAILIVTGNPGGVKKLLVPTGQSKLYVIVNNTTGGFNIELQTWSGAGLTGTGQTAVIPNASSILIFCTGTDCFAVAPYTAYTAVPVTFDGYAAGSTLTVTSAPSAPIAIGQTVYNPGILYNYSGFPSGTTITGFGTGTGGTGTYTLSVSTYPTPPYPASTPIAVGAVDFPQPIVALNTLNQIATVDYVQSKSSSVYLQDAPTADTATAAAYEGQIATTGANTGVLIISKFYVTGNPIGLGQYLNADAISDGTYVSSFGTGASDANATFTGFISGTTLTVTAGSVTGTITNAQYIIANGTALASGTKITGGSALSWTVNNSQTLGSASSPVSFTALGPILVGSVADKLGWVNVQIDNGLPMAAIPRTPIISFLSPLQLSNVLFSSNVATLIGTLGTQNDDAVNILGGVINNVTLNNVTFGALAIPTGTITKVAGNTSAGGLASVNPGALGSALSSTTGASVSAGSFLVNSQYTITSLGSTTFTSIGATSGTFTGTINNLAAPPAAGTTLTVTAGSGVAVGQFLTGSGITVGTQIVSQLTSTTFQVNTSQLVGSTTITRTDPVFIASGVGSGTGTATLNQWGLASGPLVQQGTGFGQLLGNTVKIGWNGSNLLATVDSTNLGSILGVGGYGQTWVNKTGSRSFYTVFTNGTGRPIMFSVSNEASDSGIEIYVNSVRIGFSGQDGGTGNDYNNMTAIVPAGATYQAIPRRVVGTLTWVELTT